ncbi:halocyanin [Halobacteriales archaeon QS_8_69_26]|nr:MAG: halocyanin [Halobacteriales archaeon QS_8_69_26]
MKRRALLATAGATLAGGAGCLGTLGSGGASCGSDCDVGMSTNAFLPEEYEVPVGTTVVWKNTSSRAHTVTAYEQGIPDDATFFASGGFESESAARDGWRDLDGGIDPNETYEQTVEVPGTYQYFCIPHERGGMVGKLVVTE